MLAPDSRIPKVCAATKACVAAGGAPELSLVVVLIGLVVGGSCKTAVLPSRVPCGLVLAGGEEEGVPVSRLHAGDAEGSRIGGRAQGVCNRSATSGRLPLGNFYFADGASTGAQDRRGAQPT